MPNTTFVGPARNVPVSVTSVPPAVDPVTGLTDVTTGGGLTTSSVNVVSANSCGCVLVGVSRTLRPSVYFPTVCPRAPARRQGDADRQPAAEEGPPKRRVPTERNEDDPAEAAGPHRARRRRPDQERLADVAIVVPNSSPMVGDVDACLSVTSRHGRAPPT